MRKWRRRIYGAVVIIACLWVIVMSLLSIFGNGFFYKVISPMPYLRQTDTHIIFYSWYWLWLPMTISSGKLLECDGRIMSFAPVEVTLPGGVAHNEYEWEKPLGASGKRCVIKGNVTYSPFGPLGAKMAYPWVSDPFTLPE